MISASTRIEVTDVYTEHDVYVEQNKSIELVS